jgi:hypothetical protein
LEPFPLKFIRSEKPMKTKAREIEDLFEINAFWWLANRRKNFMQINFR